MRRKKKGSLPNTIKALPITVAVAALASGGLFANAADAPEAGKKIHVHNGSGYITFSENNASASDKSALKNAFLYGNSIIIEDEDGNAVEFGKNAGKGSLSDIQANPDSYAPSDDAYLPYGE